MAIELVAQFCILFHCSNAHWIVREKYGYIKKAIVLRSKYMSNWLCHYWTSLAKNEETPNLWVFPFSCKFRGIRSFKVNPAELSKVLQRPCDKRCISNFWGKWRNSHSIDIWILQYSILQKKQWNFLVNLIQWYKLTQWI